MVNDKYMFMMTKCSQFNAKYSGCKGNQADHILSTSITYLMPVPIHRYITCKSRILRANEPVSSTAKYRPSRNLIGVLHTVGANV